jgi:Uri superfamily endonuclease
VIHFCGAPVPGYTKLVLERDQKVSADYLLIIYMEEDISVDVGSLGTIQFQKGSYLYTGSAKAGLWGRVKRHLGSPEKIRWHIDRLTSLSNRKSVWWKHHRDNGECRAASILQAKYKNIDGFGSSDCKCPSHLFYAGKEPAFLKKQIE